MKEGGTPSGLPWNVERRAAEKETEVFTEKGKNI